MPVKFATAVAEHLKQHMVTNTATAVSSSILAYVIAFHD
jgi:hypothetical protein